jgi:hypothetical protein
VGGSLSRNGVRGLEADFRGVRGCTSTTSELSGLLAPRSPEGGKVSSEYAVMPERRAPVFSRHELQTQISRVELPEEARWAPGLHSVNIPIRYKNYDVKLINLSRRGTLVLRWVQEKGEEAKSELQRYSWSSRLAEVADAALSVAGNYDIFLSCFPMWHRNRLLAELCSDSTLRFTVPGGPPARRVSAFYKGFRAVSMPVQDEGLVLTADQERERAAVVSQCF